MNQCLENPPSDEVYPNQDTPAPDCADGAPVAVDATKGRVLVLEDDESFREILSAFLTENGYTVVAVTNGADGVREVLTGKFAMILCDLMMPTLPGDMFYRAVERIDPSLRTRFVFMSGHRCDEKMNAFIKSLGGRALQKPFPLSHLLDMFALADVCETFQTVCVADPNALREAPVRPPIGRAQPIAPAVESPRPEPAVSVSAMPSTRKPKPWMFALAGLALTIVVSLVLGFEYQNARLEADRLSDEVQKRRHEWTAISASADNARLLATKFRAMLDGVRRVEAERAGPKWTPALRCIASSTGEGDRVARDPRRGKARWLTRFPADDRGARRGGKTARGCGPIPAVAERRIGKTVSCHQAAAL